MKALPALTAAVALTLVAACSTGTTPQPAAQADGADSPADPTTSSNEAEVTLRIGTDDNPGVPSADQIQEFARQVAELSEGRIEIEPVWSAAGAGRADWDQEVARLAVSGDLELALVPSRAWDTEGVETLRPLNAPFLIDSHELLAAVLTNDVVTEMLSGLESAGVVGLSAFPEGLRYPFAFEGPLLSVDDFDGATIRVPTSATSQAMFEAFGATTDGSPQVNRNVHTGMESGFVLRPGGVATSNAIFYPKVNVLVANAEAFSGLSEGDRDILEQAAENTLDWAVAGFPTEHSLADEFCSAGGVVVHAADDQLQSLRAAAMPVLSDIRAAAEQNAAVLDAIGRLKAALPAPMPAPACGELVEAAGTGQESQLDGVYRFEITREVMLSTWPEHPPSNIPGNLGTWTISLNGGKAFLHGVDSFEVIDDVGSYRVEGDRVSFIWADSTTPEVLSWERDEEGNLHFTVVNVPNIFQFVYTEPWQLVPDLEPWHQ